MHRLFKAISILLLAFLSACSEEAENEPLLGGAWVLAETQSSNGQIQKLEKPSVEESLQSSDFCCQEIQITGGNKITIYETDSLKYNQQDYNYKLKYEANGQSVEQQFLIYSGETLVSTYTVAELAHNRLVLVSKNSNKRFIYKRVATKSLAVYSSPFANQEQSFILFGEYFFNADFLIGTEFTINAKTKGYKYTYKVDEDCERNCTQATAKIECNYEHSEGLFTMAMEQTISNYTEIFKANANLSFTFTDNVEKISVNNENITSVNADVYKNIVSKADASTCQMVIDRDKEKVKAIIACRKLAVEGDEQAAVDLQATATCIL